MECFSVYQLSCRNEEGKYSIHINFFRQTNYLVGSNGKMAHPNQEPVASTFLQGFLNMIILTYFRQFIELVNRSVIKLILFIIYLFCVLCDIFKAIMSYNSCRFMRLENVFLLCIYCHGKISLKLCWMLRKAYYLYNTNPFHTNCKLIFATNRGKLTHHTYTHTRYKFLSCVFR